MYSKVNRGTTFCSLKHRKSRSEGVRGAEFAFRFGGEL